MSGRGQARHAVVTGGGGGIGLAIAAELARSCNVTIMGRDVERLRAAASTLPRTVAQACDVTGPASVTRAFAAAVDASGPVAILVNNAGLVRTAPFEKQTAQDWDDMWRTNVLGAVNTIQATLGPMRALQAGRIINVASTSALKGYAYVSAYTASKHALLGLTRSLALELARTAVTVNAICPGYAETEIVAQSIENIVAKTGRSTDVARAALTATNPQGRLIDPAEVAAAVGWLIGEGARSVTGQAITIAGGEVM